MKKTRVLWIEDNAYSDLQHTLGPVLVDGRYDLVIAESASEGIERILSQEFDAVIVDIRLPPGKDPGWIEIYNDGAANRMNARLGLEILQALLGPEDAKNRLDAIPSWVQPNRFAVFSVEPLDEVRNTVEMLGIPVYVQKTAETSTRVLLDILRKLEEVRTEGK